MGTVITKLAESTIILLLVVGFCAATLRSQSANSPNSSNNAITGRVTQHGKGLGDVVVKAWRPPWSQPPRDALEVKTDFEGYYRITSVPPSNYYVAAYRPGLVPARNDNLSGSPRAVSVSAGERVEGVDFQLVGGGVITGKVTDRDGRSVSEEPVMLTEVKPQPNPTLSRPNPAMTAFTSGLFRTDDRGIYRIYGIPAGSYQISVGAEFTAFTAIGGRPPYRQTFFPGTTEKTRARVIEVTEDAVISNIDINVGSSVPTFSVSGRIINSETEETIPAVSYDIEIAGASGGGEIPEAGTSNNSGEFKLHNLTAGRYSVRISESRLNAEASEFFGESSWFEIRDSDVSGIEVRATRTVGVSGTVVVEDTNNQAVLAKASQLELLFEINPKAGGPFFVKTAKPESDLSFSVRGLKPGQLRIFLNLREQGESMGLRFRRMELKDSTPVREIEIKGGEQLNGLRVVLGYGSGSVRGFVKLENGVLPAEAKAYARVTNDKGFFAGSWVDSQGSFLIEALPAGNYTLTVSAEVPGKRTLGPEAHQPISVSEGNVSQAVVVLDLTALRSPAP